MENFNSKICPKCLNEYSKKTIACEQCNITLMKKSTYNKKTSEEIYAIKNHKNINIVKKQKVNIKSNIILGIVVIILLFFMIYGLFDIFTTPSKPNPRICKRCDKTFTDSDNTWSIAYSGFCEKCHDDFEFIQDVQEELEKY